MPSILRLAALPLLLALAACASDEAGDALRRGDAALGRLRFDEAAEHFTEALEAEPESAAAYLGRGQAYWTSNQFGLAVMDLDRALALHPDLPWAYYFRGSARLQLGRFEEGIADLDRAAQAEGLPVEDRMRAHYLRAVAHMHLEDYGAGVEALTAGIALQPEHAFYYFERGQLHEALGHAEEAVADYERYLALAGPGGGEMVESARYKLGLLRGARPEIVAGR